MSPWKLHREGWSSLLLLASVIIYNSCLVVSAAAPPSGFTYQGFLTINGVPANGMSDFEFRIFNAATAGDQQGATLTLQDVGVTNGLFTAGLDFGANVFDGGARWLEIGVRPGASGGAYTNLVPRQPVTSTPYAILASGAAASGIIGVLPASALAGNYVGAVSFSNVSNSFSGNGAGLTNINATTLGGVSAARLWTLNGNSNTTFLDFLGTTDNNPLRLVANRSLGLQIIPHANPTNPPNIVGGQGEATPGIFGGTISGGGLANDSFGNDFRNRVQANLASVGGGLGNSAAGYAAVVSGGFRNVASNSMAAVLGGASNLTTGVASVVTGGSNNIASGSFSLVVGGVGNRAEGDHATVVGGFLNSNLVFYSFIGGGSYNRTLGPSSVIAGGDQNRVDGFGFWAVIGGGNANVVSSERGVIGGGFLNRNEGRAATIAGGERHYVTATNATVAGGYSNVVSGHVGFIGGGRENVVSGSGGSVAGGLSNRSTGDRAHIGGGYANEAAGNFATIAGGQGNVASAPGATIAGGEFNQATGSNAIIPGGRNNSAGQDSLAAGTQAKAVHTGAFVWADATGANLSSATNHSVTFRAAGGYRLFSNSGATAGVSLAADGTSWAVLSDRNAKKDITPVNAVAVLDQLARLPIASWRYQWETDNATPHLGPMAQDFKAAFYPGREDTTITTLEADGVALVAIQGLNQKVDAANSEAADRLRKLEAENDQLKQQLAEIKSALEALTDKRPPSR